MNHLVRKITLATAASAAILSVSAAADAATRPAKPRRKIVVSSIGPATLRKPPELDTPQKIVDFMIDYWTKEIAPVLPDHPDLIVLPELCDRFAGQSAAEYPVYYEVRGNQIRDAFAAIAKANSCYIVYPAARKCEDGSYRNSAWLIGRQGEIVGVYDKNYPTIGDINHNGTLAGRQAPVFETDFGRVGVAICFDLNFQELLERYAVQRPDLIVFPSYYHGGLMQNYWAYHCRSYFVGCFAGGENTVVNPVGTTVARSTNYFHRVTASINLDYQVVHLDENWEKLDALKAKYGRGVTVFDPGFVGAVLVTSELDDVTSDSMIKEFKIELWDEYYRRSVDHRNLPTSLEP